MNFFRGVLDIKFAIPLIISIMIATPIGAWMSQYVKKEIVEWIKNDGLRIGQKGMPRIAVGVPDRQMQRRQFVVKKDVVGQVQRAEIAGGKCSQSDQNGQKEENNKRSKEDNDGCAVFPEAGHHCTECLEWSGR